jgi:DNA-binding transcriptional MocR family regulator
MGYHHEQADIYRCKSAAGTRPTLHLCIANGKNPRSFIREILKVTADPAIISFAGGLPNPGLIDVKGIRKAAAAVLERDGRNVLQYSMTEGYLPPEVYRGPV